MGADLLCTVWTQIFCHKLKTNVSVLLHKVKKKMRVSCLTTMQNETKLNLQ